MTSDSTTRESRTGLILYALSVAAILTASFFPDLRLWGLNWYAYFGWAGKVVFLVAVILAPLVIYRLIGPNRSNQPEEQGSETLYWIVGAVLVLISILLFYLLKTETHFLGDGYLLLTRLTEGTQEIRPWNPAAYFIQRLALKVVPGTGEPAALAAFRLISIGSGVFFLFALLYAARRLYARFCLRWLFVVGVASGGYSLVFFGYVENYPAFILVTAIFGLLGILAARRMIGRYWLLIPLILGLPIHPFAVAMIPGALYIITRGTAVGERFRLAPWWLKAVLAAVVLAATGYGFHFVYTTNYFFRFAVVPFVQNRFTIEGYTMLSAKHLLDYLSLFWIYLPGLLLGLYLLVRGWRLLKTAEYLFLILYGLAGFGIAFLFDPKLGMPRDWDMFCFAGLPLVLLVVMLGLDERVRPGRSPRLIGLIAILGFSLLIPRAIIQAEPDRGVDLFDSYSSLDRYKTGGGRFLLLKYLEKKGRHDEVRSRRTVNAGYARFEFWDAEAQQLMRRSDYHGAIRVYEKLLDSFPVYHNAWTNMGISFYQLREYDSAVACLRISDGLNPYSFFVYHYMAVALYARGDNAEAEQRWLKAMEFKPKDYRPYTYLLLMYEYDKRPEDYDRIAEHVLKLAREPGAQPLLIGQAATIHLKRQEWTEAVELAQLGLRAGLEPVYICDLQKRFPEFRLLNCEESSP